MTLLKTVEYPKERKEYNRTKDPLEEKWRLLGVDEEKNPWCLEFGKEGGGGRDYFTRP